MKKQILFGLLAAGAMVTALTGCDTQGNVSTPSAPISSSSVASQASDKEAALTKTQEYLSAHFPNQYTATFLKEETISEETYCIMDVRTNTGENQVMMEPTLAVKASDGSLWAYYPDGKLETVAANEIWQAQDEPASISPDKVLALAQDYAETNFPDQYVLELMKQEPTTQKGESYYLVNVKTNTNSENQVTVEPILAVKASDGSLWAYYPDGKLVDVAQDQIWKPKA